MTDRIFAYTVTLEREIRDDDAQRITDAIKMIRGVADAVPLVAEPQAYWERTRARRELEEKLWQALNSD